MTTTASTDTLRHVLAVSPVATKSPLHVSCAHVANSINTFMGTTDFSMKDTARPETEAVKFYIINHAMAALRERVGLDRPVGRYAPVVDAYRKVLPRMTQRVISYVTLIVTREARHKKKNVSTLLGGLHDASALAFIDSLTSGSTGAAMAFRQSPPTCGYLQYLRAVSSTFYKGGFASAYGGPKWGNISDTLLRYVDGTYSAEMMMDLAWALAHNGGPMFNKGMIYDHYSSKSLYTVLDVQRAGQIPQLVNQGFEYADGWTVEFAATCRELFGEAFDGAVDWQAVVDAGAVQSYGPKMTKTGKVTTNPYVQHASKIAVGPKVKVGTKTEHKRAA